MDDLQKGLRLKLYSFVDGQVTVRNERCDVWSQQGDYLTLKQGLKTLIVNLRNYDNCEITPAHLP